MSLPVNIYDPFQTVLSDALITRLREASDLDEFNMIGQELVEAMGMLFSEFTIGAFDPQTFMHRAIEDSYIVDLMMARIFGTEMRTLNVSNLTFEVTKPPEVTKSPLEKVLSKLSEQYE